MVETEKEKIPVQQAVMFLLYRNGEFLFEVRKDPEKVFFGETIIPGGIIEEGELAEDAVPREAREEHGVFVKDFVWLDDFIDEAPKGEPTYVHAFLVTMFEGQVVAREPERADLVWMSAEKAEKLLEVKSSRHVLRLAQNYLNEEGQSRD